MSGNNAWFEQNCEPEEVLEENEAVASRRRNIRTPRRVATPNTDTRLL